MPTKIRRPQLLLIASWLLWALPANSAPKTDIVVFKNGDRLTGEFISLNRGRLNLNTEATGTIGIEWNRVSSIVTSQRIQVETSNGSRYFGELTASEKILKVAVMSDNGVQTLDSSEVISMTPIEGRGIHGLDVEVSLGYNFTKAGDVKTGTLGLDMDYRSLLRIESLSFSTTISGSNTQEINRRTNLGLRHTRLWIKRWFATGNLSFDQNDELGLNLRTSIGAGFGRYVVQSNSTLLALEGGLQYSRENLISENDDLDSLEATISANWDWFLFEESELDWSTTLQIIPSATETGRVRGELDSAIKWEIINDLKWVFSILASYDNQPQSTTGSANDYGVNMTLAYDF